MRNVTDPAPSHGLCRVFLCLGRICPLLHLLPRLSSLPSPPVDVRPNLQLLAMAVPEILGYGRLLRRNSLAQIQPCDRPRDPMLLLSARRITVVTLVLGTGAHPADLSKLLRKLETVRLLATASSRNLRSLVGSRQANSSNLLQ